MTIIMTMMTMMMIMMIMINTDAYDNKLSVDLLLLSITKSIKQ